MVNNNGVTLYWTSQCPASCTPELLTLDMVPDRLDVLLKCRFEFSGSGCGLRGCMSDKLLDDAYTAGPGPTEQHKGAAHPTGVQ